MIPRNSPHDLRLQRLSLHLHKLGPRSTYEALREIDGGGDVFAVLDEYRRLDPDVVRLIGADRMPPSGPLPVPRWRAA